LSNIAIQNPFGKGVDEGRDEGSWPVCTPAEGLEASHEPEGQKAEIDA